jgi:dihydroflavonol-4-reductase
MQRSTVLVTGATGFIGSHLVERLLPLAGRLRCLARHSSSVERIPSDVELVRADLFSGEGVHAALSGVDTVFHLAGVTKTLDPRQYHAGNVTAAETLARAAGGVTRFVHVSSLAAAGPAAEDMPLTEESAPHPVSRYGTSKLAGEEAIRHILPDAVIVRPPVVYGPRDTDVYEMLRALHRGWDVRISREERWFSAIYVSDLVDGLIAAATAVAAPGKIYFLAHPEPVSWTVFSSTAAKLLNRTPRKIVFPRQAAHAAGWLGELCSYVSGKPGILSRDKVAEAAYPCWTCATARACRDLGFRAKTPVAEGLALTLAWYRENGWL